MDYTTVQGILNSKEINCIRGLQQYTFLQVSENISHSVLILIKTVGKLCKLMKALTRQSENILYFWKYRTFLLDLLICLWNTYLQIICKGIDKFLLKTFLKKIISLFLLVRAFITSYFLPRTD